MIIPAFVLWFFGLTGWGILATYPLVTIAAAMILAAVLSDSPPSPMRKGPLVYLGKISYGLYVFHLLVLQVIERVRPTPHHTFDVLIALIGTVTVAMASYALLERPFLKLKARFAHVASRPA
jgi:peptidoglycan/LPS O-acetylase OafA/YrhL